MEWYQELETKYIHLFETYDVEDEMGTISRPVRGIEVGYGWKRHVEDFLESLDWHTKHNKKKDKDNVIKIFQIKEKFGQVRCYVSSDDHINHLVHDAVARLEGKCSLTCETCGKLEYSILKDIGGWMISICNECNEKRTN